MRAILMLHSVDHSGSVLSIEPGQLRTLIRSIRRSGHELVSLRDILGAPPAPRQVALTFDDGMRSLHANALPVLQEEAAPATVFLVTDYIGSDNRWPSLPADAPTMRMMGWDQVEDLRAAGVDLQAHTATHPDLRVLADDAIREEFERGNQTLEERLGHRPDLFAYPYGYYDDRVAEIAGNYYRHSVTTEMRALGADDPQRIPRLETYYFRSPEVHSRFGTLLFSAYLAARSALRRIRHG